MPRLVCYPKLCSLKYFFVYLLLACSVGQDFVLERLHVEGHCSGCLVLLVFIAPYIFFILTIFLVHLVSFKFPFMQPVRKLNKTRDNGKLFVAEICRLFVLEVGKNNSLGHG